MTYRTLYVLSILLPTAIIGGFEFIRHDFLLPVMSMETGNVLITLLTLLLSFLYARWMFRTIHRMNEQLAEERARRAVYEERERLARELHDGIAQSLFYLSVTLKQGRLDDARSAVAAIDQQVRQSIFNLRALPEEGHSLPNRLDKWLNQWSTITGVDVSHDMDIPVGHFTPSQEVHLFGVIQEAFANIRKHADARHAHLTLKTLDDGGWELAVTDDGRGIGDTDNNRPRYGLPMMRERAAELGADFSLTARETGGTELRLVRRPGGAKR